MGIKTRLPTSDLWLRWFWLKYNNRKYQEAIQAKQQTEVMRIPEVEVGITETPISPIATYAGNLVREPGNKRPHATPQKGGRGGSSQATARRLIPNLFARNLKLYRIVVCLITPNYWAHIRLRGIWIFWGWKIHPQLLPLRRLLPEALEDRGRKTRSHKRFVPKNRHNTQRSLDWVERERAAINPALDVWTRGGEHSATISESVRE